MTQPDKSIPVVPAPWELKATVYSFLTYTSSSQSLPAFAYSDLEGNHPPFASTSKFVGGLGSVQLIRYSESPVGPYDELLLVPGYFEWEDEQGGKKVKRKNVRVSRIYVSTEDTCWNGRKNWNIPKHLARFHFTEPSPGTMKVSVYPSENPSNSKAFFTATYKPISYLPNFPFSTKILGYVGLDPLLIQPPLPQGKGKEGEVMVGTSEWVKILPKQYSQKTSLGWWDLKQDSESEDGRKDGIVESFSEYENWWPGGSRYRIGVKMEDAVVLFGNGEVVRSKTDGSRL